MEFQRPNEKSAKAKSSVPFSYPAILLTEGCQEARFFRSALQPAAGSHAGARTETVPEARPETGMITRMVTPAWTVRPMWARWPPVRLAIAPDAAIIDIAAAAPAAIRAGTPIGTAIGGQGRTDGDACDERYADGCGGRSEIVVRRVAVAGLNGDIARGPSQSCRHKSPGTSHNRWCNRQP